RPGARALALQGALELRIDVLDLSLAPQVCRDLLGPLVDHGRHDPLLYRLEGGSRALAAVVDPHDVPAELALERLADLAPLQPNPRFPKLRHPLPATEEAEFSALVLRSRVLGVLLGQLREVAAMGELFVDLARLVPAVDQNVAGAHLLIRLQCAQLAIVEVLCVRIGDGRPDAPVEIGIAQRAAAPILHALIEALVCAQVLAFGRVGEELVLDQEFNEHAPFGGRGERAQIAADLGLGELHVGVGDHLAVDLGDHPLLRAGRRSAKGGQTDDEQGDWDMRQATPQAHVGVSSRWFLAPRSARGASGQVSHNRDPTPSYQCVMRASWENCGGTAAVRLSHGWPRSLTMNVPVLISGWARRDRPFATRVF